MTETAGDLDPRIQNKFDEYEHMFDEYDQRFTKLEDSVTEMKADIRGIQAQLALLMRRMGLKPDEEEDLFEKAKIEEAGGTNSVEAIEIELEAWNDEGKEVKTQKGEEVEDLIEEKEPLELKSLVKHNDSSSEHPWVEFNGKNGGTWVRLPFISFCLAGVRWLEYDLQWSRSAVEGDEVGSEKGTTRLMAVIKRDSLTLSYVDTGQVVGPTGKWSKVGGPRKKKRGTTGHVTSIKRSLWAIKGTITTSSLVFINKDLWAPLYVDTGQEFGLFERSLKMKLEINYVSLLKDEHLLLPNIIECILSLNRNEHILQFLFCRRWVNNGQGEIDFNYHLERKDDLSITFPLLSLPNSSSSLFPLYAPAKCCTLFPFDTRDELEEFQRLISFFNSRHDQSCSLTWYFAATTIDKEGDLVDSDHHIVHNKEKMEELNVGQYYEVQGNASTRITEIRSNFNDQNEAHENKVTIFQEQHRADQGSIFLKEQQLKVKTVWVQEMDMLLSTSNAPLKVEFQEYTEPMKMFLHIFMGLINGESLILQSTYSSSLADKTV